MKKFSFSLDNVLNYKNQVLEHLQGEHALILDEIRSQQGVIEEIKNQYGECCRSLKEEQLRGTTVIQLHTYENYLSVLSYRLKKEQEVLAILQRKEEIKRNQVVEAKKESASIEKLREKKVEAYNKEVQKAEELLIEEFISNNRSKKQFQAG